VDVRRPLALLPVLAVACAVVAGCGSATSTAPVRPPGPVAADAPQAPALLRAPRAAGEVVVRGEASPASHGPVALHGRYLVRFEQYAPEDPRLDFGAQTAFVATLDRRPEQEGAGSVRLFRAAERRGSVRVRLDGRFWIDVAFGDFPYVVRLTPLR
jgi:hypothetical protein